LKNQAQTTSYLAQFIVTFLQPFRGLDSRNQGQRTYSVLLFNCLATTSNFFFLWFSVKAESVVGFFG
jgi:hypothetical protein